MAGTATRNQKRAVAQTERYRRFLRDLDIKSIALVESSFRIDRRRYFKVDEHERAITWRTLEKGTGKGFFEPRIVLMLTASQEGSPKPFLELEASFELHIHIEEDGAETDQLIEQFCASEIKLIVWPFFREYVTNVTARMHVPPLTLPILGRD